jgi:ribonuclease HII
VAHVLGIDEAGLSPVVGPLVVSGTLFKTTEEFEGANFWRLLQECVSSSVRGANGRLVVADSKKLHKKGDLTRLEEGVFSFLYTRGAARITNLAQMLKQLNAQVEHEQYPWYRPQDLKLPTKIWRNTARKHADKLKSEMRKVGMAFVGAYSEPVLEGQFNADLSRTRNKAMLLWERVSRIIYNALKVCPEENLTVCIDKLGGRARYDNLLEDVLGEMRPKRARAGKDISAYEYTFGGRRVRVLFIKSGEEKALPVALASMLSKYVRELFLLQLNAWFCEHLPGLKPTAGYHKDGWRFIDETREFREANGIPETLIIRRS